MTKSIFVALFCLASIAHANDLGRLGAAPFPDPDNVPTSNLPIDEQRLEAAQLRELAAKERENARIENRVANLVDYAAKSALQLKVEKLLGPMKLTSPAKIDTRANEGSEYAPSLKAWFSNDKYICVTQTEPIVVTSELLKSGEDQPILDEKNWESVHMKIDCRDAQTARLVTPEIVADVHLRGRDAGEYTLPGSTGGHDLVLPKLINGKLVSSVKHIPSIQEKVASWWNRNMRFGTPVNTPEALRSESQMTRQKGIQ